VFLANVLGQESIRKHLHHHLVLYLSLPPVLQLKLMFLANVLGQESTLEVCWLTRCTFTYIVSAALLLVSSFALTFHPSDLVVVSIPYSFVFVLTHATHFVSPLSCLFTHLTGHCRLVLLYSCY